MTFLPVIPWWIILPLWVLVAGAIGWRVLGRRSGEPGRRDWLFRGLLVALVFVAALRPGIDAGGSATAQPADVDVFLAVDTTSSMSAEDYGDGEPRLLGVRSDISSVTEQLAGARFSLLTFAAEATVRIPLTTDTGALATAAEVLSPEITDYARGSSITAAGPLLDQRLRAARDQHPERLRFVFYLGDGEQTSDAVAGSFRVDRSLVDGGAVLGYGTADGGRMLEYAGGARDSLGGDYIQDRRGDGATDALSKINEGALRAIAENLGVPYVHRSAGDSTDALLRNAQPSGMATGTARQAGGGGVPARTELAWLFALAAFGVGLREVTLSARRLQDTVLPPLGGPR
ncbi:VWA domain-containing protein [Pseudarthrobacter sp. PS3-L1]|uniref:VWA domain-containing protein n=1 Tax=Pseudarthrobacter sp. PS3-L1 TaxID=3046207 RepID=UPI0024B97B2E|nr:VWA domain-containing protein [Pseudarthrobacter sp. PS3-L1]MDJ0319872.1 VWA domain-containing protein [Pseudarthrobacter sp. PS3-L1]